MGLEHQGFLVCGCQRFAREHLHATGVQVPDVHPFIVFQRNRVAPLDNLHLHRWNEITGSGNQPILASLSLCVRRISKLFQRPEKQMVILGEDDNILHPTFKLFTWLQEEFCLSPAQLHLPEMLNSRVINWVSNHTELSVGQSCEIHLIDKLLMDLADVSLCHVNGDQPLCSGSALDLVHIGKACQSTKLNCSHLGENFGSQRLQNLLVNRWQVCPSSSDEPLFSRHSLDASTIRGVCGRPDLQRPVGLHNNCLDGSDDLNLFSRRVGDWSLAHPLVTRCPLHVAILEISRGPQSDSLVVPHNLHLLRRSLQSLAWV
mmetsp:Transcript_38055/g.91301  ORF Transcript_38055/g.91301 Transcript_38055/m.91301 type:complete len:317 (+) Transcript_38055:1441-2391(+)